MTLGVQLEWLDLAGPDQPDRTLAMLASKQVDALLINSAGSLCPIGNKVTDLAIERRDFL